MASSRTLLVPSRRHGRVYLPAGDHGATDREELPA